MHLIGLTPSTAHSQTKLLRSYDPLQPPEKHDIKWLTPFFSAICIANRPPLWALIPCTTSTSIFLLTIPDIVNSSAIDTAFGRARGLRADIHYRSREPPAL